MAEDAEEEEVMNKPASIYRPCADVGPPLVMPGHRVQRYDRHMPVCSLPGAKKEPEVREWPPRLKTGALPEGAPDFVDGDGQAWYHGYHGPR